jgi:hypothetical protein
MPAPPIEHDAFAEHIRTIHAEVDALTLRYDSRVLAAVMLSRAANLLNKLWRTEQVTDGFVAGAFEAAVEIASDDSPITAPIVIRDEVPKSH